MKIKVENEKDLVRDSNSHAILATNKEELHRYRARKNIMREKDEKILNLENRLHSLENLVNNILNNSNGQ
jgi:hypothetical protein